MLPKAVAEGRRIARNIHRLGRLYMTKTFYAAFLILAAAIFGFAFPFLPRQLTVAAILTIGIPSFVLALAPSEGPLYRGRLLQALTAFSLPAGIGIGIGSLLSFFLVDSIFGGTLNEGRTAATTTLIVLGLAFILLLERGPGREHIAIQSYMLAMVTALGALFALILAAAPVRDFFDLELLSAGQWFLVAGGGRRRARRRQRALAPALHPASRGRTADPPERPRRSREAMPAHTSHKRVSDGAARSVEVTGPCRRTRRAARRSSPPRPGLARAGDARRDDRGGRRRLPAQLLPRRRPRTTPRTSSGSARPSRQTGKWVGVLGDLPGPKLRLAEVEDGVVRVRSGTEIELTTEECLGTRGAAAGRLRRPARRGRRRRSDLPRRRADPPARAGGRGRRRPLRGRDRRLGRLPPGRQPARRRDRGCRRRAPPTWTGSSSPSSTRSTCSPSRSCAAPPTSSPVNERIRSAAPTSR